MLLRELIKTTPEDRPEFQKLTEAFNLIDEMLTFVNEKKRDIEMYYKVKQIAKLITGVPDVSFPNSYSFENPKNIEKNRKFVKYLP